MAGYPVYSERFLTVEVPGVWVAWWCPQGMRAVVRSIAFTNRGVGPAFFMVAGSAGVLALGIQEPNTTRVIDHRAVLYGGEFMQGLADIANAFITISGYLFADSSGAAGAPGELTYKRAAETKPTPGPVDE